MVGVAGCGKTALLYQLQLGMAITTVPTLGYNVETLTINGKEINILDVGGDWNYRHGLWRHFIPGADGIIFVVDSSDESQIDAAKTALCGLYRDCEAQLKRSVLLVFANKQDQLDALSVAEVKDRIGMGLETIQAEGGRCVEGSGRFYRNDQYQDSSSEYQGSSSEYQGSSSEYDDSSILGDLNFRFVQEVDEELDDNEELGEFTESETDHDTDSDEGSRDSEVSSDELEITQVNAMIRWILLER
ncbi:hypothetical protein KI688_002348 [Linnemannia hyalina]|uniref:Uncharacterized protein n=1 Tax=Linnemannia hyalina TaxID=64524 RepID=A0A9P7XQY4_9FUNG|nr:hypothetical protein KI688_002348 [Linnemannia hyalina]